jgi:glycosyltransferase involved in cell wall biosynthesis
VSSTGRLRVLLVPDSVFWVTGTICRSIARHNRWLDATVISGSLLERTCAAVPDLLARVDLVHFVCPYASRSWLPRLRDSHACVTTHHHVTDWELQKHNLDADAIMTDSEQWVDDLVERGVDRARVLSVPPGVDCELFVPSLAEARARTRRRLGIARDQAAIGFFGKASSNEMGRKGVDVMTAAARLLLRRGTRFSLVMTGPGWRDAVAELRRAGVQVAWRAFVRERRELAQLYGALDFYWVTSRIEGGPVTLLEAMSAEVCCVSTPVGLAREAVLDGENAVLVPIGDPAAVAEATAGLAGDLERRRKIGRRARADVRARLDCAITMRRAGDLYARALRAFAARRGRPVAEGIAEPLEAAAPRGAEPSDQADGDGAWPMAAVPEPLHAPLRRWETIAWAEHLARHQGQQLDALRLMASEVRRAPLEGETWRALLRNALPEPIARWAVRARRRARS